MTDEEHVLVCSPADAEPHAPSVKVQGDCGHEVWISAATAALTLNAGVKITTRCIRCVDPKMLAEAITGGNVREIPGQREEIAEVIGEEETDRAFKMLGAKQMGE